MVRHHLEACRVLEPEQRGDALAHLVGSLACEGDRQDAARVDALAHEMKEAPGERTGLARARPRP